MDFVSPIITPIVESLMIPFKKHLGFLVSSTKYVRNMNAKMKQLNDTAQEVQAKWDMAFGNTEVVPERVEPWLEDVKSLNERSNLIKAIGCFNVAKRYKVGKQSYDILEEIKDLDNRESKIVFTHAQKPLAEVGSSSTHPFTSSLVPMVTQNNFKSRDLIFRNALKALQSNDESQRMIALCGMGGVGKTTMMEQLKKVVEDLNMFHLVVKVVIGQNSDAISLQQAIAQYIGIDLTESAKDARADRLRKIFEAKSQQGQKKILVIMDDLWDEPDLNDVGLSPLPHGFKMMFTSRFENVCTHIGVRTHSIFRIGVLSKTEAKTLFSVTVELSPSDINYIELQRIGEDIAMKCGGLPIAIVTIAKTLTGNIKEAWQKVLWRLEKDELKDLEKITHRIFEMSYENLKEDDDKAVFLLCGLFPDDYNINTGDLLRYGWGLHFFKDVKTLAFARRHMKICVNNLIRANLLIESERNGFVKMHDLVRAFVLNSFSKVKQASIVNQKNMEVHMLTNDSNMSYERVLFKCTNMCEVPRDFNCSNLSLFILMNGSKLKLPEDIYERMEKLKVVSYENLGIPLLPLMFEHSTKLRTICLRSCLLINSDISFLGSLYNLEILSLVACNIRRLPSTIGRLKKLKLLDLTGCIDLHIDEGVIQNLDSLEELYMRAHGGHVVRFTHANCEELQEISQHLFALELEFIAWTPPKHSLSRQDKSRLKNMSFKNLERFNIYIGCELEKEYFEDYSFNNKNRLNLVATCNELHECNISDLFDETEELNLQVNDMYNVEDISMNHTFWQLRVFDVSRCANLTCLFTPDAASGLRKLERLTISKCRVLKAMVSKNSGVREVITFKKLNFLSLKNLPSMVTLCEDVIHLPELMELRLHGLPNLTSICHDNNRDISATQSLFNTKVMMPKLEKLDISMMESLKQVWSCEISIGEKNEVSMLRNIVVRKCDSLINLFPRNPLPLLNLLEELEVKKCCSIEVLFNIDFERVSGMREYISGLRSIRVEDLKELKALWWIRGANNSDIVINGFKGVEKIEITNCQKFTNIFTPTTINFDFGALTTYTTWKIGCDIEKSYRQNKLLAERDEKNNMTYPSYLLHKCHHLQHLKLYNDKRVEEVVFEMDSPTIHDDGQLSLLLPYLEVLELSYLKEMSHVWKCNNWNKFLIPQHQPSQLPFQNLTVINLWHSHKVKYLLSPLMVKYVSNLETVCIARCDGIEEVISSRDDENEENTPSTSTSTSSHQNTTFFPHLDMLVLNRLSCLKSIDGGDQTRSRSDAISSGLSNTIHGQSQSGEGMRACWSMCQYSTKIEIGECNALTSLVPWYAVGHMERLQDLHIYSCSSMIEVFESKLSSNNINVDEGISAPAAAAAAAGTTTLITPTVFENITTTALVIVPQLSNLKIMRVTKCNLLQHLFTFSMLASLNQLKELIVERCNAIQVIVKEEINKTSSKDVQVLPRLERLKLNGLPNLKGFFLGTNEFRWPLLDDVTTNNCPQLMMFTSGQSNTPKLKYIRTGLGKYSVESCGLNFRGTTNQTKFSSGSSTSEPTISKWMPWSSFHNLIEINIDNRFYKKVGKSIIPSNVLLQLEKLQKIHLRKCLYVEEVFEVAVVEALVERSGLNESQTTTTIVTIPNLTQVSLQLMNDLKYLWKSNRSMVLLEFPNLTTLSIYYCPKLEHVFTCSMVGSLVQLRDLEISDCYNIQLVIVKEEEEEEEEECDVKVNDIMLPCLKSITLFNLSRLKGFCLGKDAFSLPALDTLQIKECRAITVFTKGDLSTPNLERIDTDMGMRTIKGDLNSFIETKQQEFSSYEDEAWGYEEVASIYEEEILSYEEVSSYEDETSSHDNETSSYENEET